MRIGGWRPPTRSGTTCVLLALPALLWSCTGQEPRFDDRRILDEPTSRDPLGLRVELVTAPFEQRRFVAKVLERLLREGWSTDADAMEYVGIMASTPRTVVSSAVYVRALEGALSLLARQPSCRDADIAVLWVGAAENHRRAADIDRVVAAALAACDVDRYASRFYAVRAYYGGARLAEDACDAVVRGDGDPRLVERCAGASNATTWKVAYARSRDGIDVRANLAKAASDPQATGTVLREFVSRANGPVPLFCDAVARGAAIERSWGTNVLDGQASVEVFYVQMAARGGCADIRSGK